MLMSLHRNLVDLDHLPYHRSCVNMGALPSMVCNNPSTRSSSFLLSLLNLCALYTLRCRVLSRYGRFAMHSARMPKTKKDSLHLRLQLSQLELERTLFFK